MSARSRRGYRHAHRVRRQVTFEDRLDAEAVAIAMMGGGNYAVHKQTDNVHSDGQVTYRLRLAKEAYGMEHGFRVAWRRGESKFFKLVKKDIFAILVKEVQRTLTPKLVHPTPQTVDR